jgi:hypothetical protein
MVSGTTKARGSKPPTNAEVLYFRVPKLAAAAGMEVREMRDWLHRAGLLERRHGKLVVTAERVACEFPEAYRRLLAADDGNDGNDGK